MKKRNGNSCSEARMQPAVTRVLFYYANRNERDHDVNHPIFFSTVSAAYAATGY